MPTAKHPTTAAKPAKESPAKAEAVKKPRAPRKPAAHKPAAEKPVHHAAAQAPAVLETQKAAAHKPAGDGKYIFATGRRKTSVANVRLFSGKGDSVVNKKPLNKYFAFEFYRHEINEPFQLTGLENDYHFVCHVNGGGPHSQAGAVRHGIAIALSQISEEVRKVLKKNGLLTRDDRQKERKKPGLKRARRAPQWAKR